MSVKSLVAVAVMAVALAGCTSSHTASPTSPTAAGTLRGTGVKVMRCHNPLDLPRNKPVPSLAVGDITADPQALLVCGVGPGGQVTLTPADGDKFTSLVEAMSLPDLPASSSPCPMDDAFYPVVLAKTSDGAWLVHTPLAQVGCDVPRSEVLTALAALQP